MIYESPTLGIVNSEELPEIYQEISDLIGVEYALKLAEYFRGQTVYFNTLDKFLREKRDEAICSEYGEKSVKELAKKYALSERTIYGILEKSGINIGEWDIDGF